MVAVQKSPRTRLYAVAEGQQGLFTARQAVAAGFDRRNHTYHVSRGNWVREARGIYRLSRFPRTPESDFSLWSLWSMGESTSPVGVLSHETALSIHDLSDVLPAKIHMTVPKDFGTRDVPDVLSLHRSDLSPTEIENRSEYRVTTVLRTFLDLAEAQTIAPDLLVQGLVQALERGSLTIAQAESHESLRKHLLEIQKYRDSEPLYKLLKMFFKPPGEPTPEYEQGMRKSAVLLDLALVSLGKWLMTPNSKIANRKSLERRLQPTPDEETQDP